MKNIFEPVCLGNLQIKNRIIRSATLESGCAENGEITPFLNKVYTDLAKSNVGLIITGMMGVGYNSCAFQGMTQIYGKTFVQRFTPIVISVGGYRSIKGIENTLNAGNISAISMSRPFICEPDLVSKWENRESRASKCVSCNRCFNGSFGCKIFKNG